MSGNGPLHSISIICDQICSIGEDMLSLINNLDAAGYSAYWSPWSVCHITQAVSMIVRAAIHHQRSSEASLVRDVVNLLDRLIIAIERGASGNWQIAEDAIARIKLFIPSICDIPGLEAIKQRLFPNRMLGAPENHPDDFLAWLLDGSDNDRMLQDMDRWLGEWNTLAVPTPESS